MAAEQGFDLGDVRVDEVVGKIIYLRQNYHFGPEKIAMCLKAVPQHHHLQARRLADPQRLDMRRLPASQRYKRHDKRWKRYEKQLPGHRVQIDVKFIEPIAGVTTGRRGGRNKYYQFTAIDDCTCLRVLRIYPTSQPEDHHLDKGIAHTYIKATHAAAEQEGGTLFDPKAVDHFSTATRAAHRIDAEVFNDKLREWEDYYNYDRPHGGLGGRASYERSSRRRRSRRKRALPY
ncbi:hypothetical protein OHR68_35840 [Spirillospora sp. NBC_00431]